MFPGHDKQLAHHPTPLPNILLHKFTPTNPNKLAVRMMCHRPCQKRLACPGGPIEEHALGLGDAKGFKEFRVFDGEFDDFFYFFYLFVEATDHFVGRVGDFFDHHEGDEGVDGDGEDAVEGVAVG
jgi:hypothetical protein